MSKMNEIDQEIKQGFENTYQAIGFDLGGFEDDNHTITRDDLFDICLDHLATYGDLETGAAEYWEALPFEKKLSYKTIVFTYEKYEVGGG